MEFAKKTVTPAQAGVQKLLIILSPLHWTQLGLHSEMGYSGRGDGVFFDTLLQLGPEFDAIAAVFFRLDQGHVGIGNGFFDRPSRVHFSQSE